MVEAILDINVTNQSILKFKQAHLLDEISVLKNSNMNFKYLVNNLKQNLLTDCCHKSYIPLCYNLKYFRT